MRFAEESFTSWNSIEEFVRNRFDRNVPEEELWVFRGQASAEWGLETALDRVRRRLYLKAADLPLIEEGLLREFQRRVCNTGARLDLPKKTNILEWLALMRHYGAPTRLLDWTYTFFVALYFAVEFADSECAVWAVDVKWCNRRSRSKIPSSEHALERVAKDPYFQNLETFQLLFSRERATPLVYRVNPFILNERLAVQKGLFLCPGDVSKSFDDNFCELQTEDDDIDRLVKMRIDPRLHSEVLRKLHYMNVSRETLFPGLDGLAQSLNSRLAIPEVFVPPWRKIRDPRPFIDWDA